MVHGPSEETIQEGFALEIFQQLAYVHRRWYRGLIPACPLERNNPVIGCIPPSTLSEPIVYELLLRSFSVHQSCRIIVYAALRS